MNYGELQTLFRSRLNRRDVTPTQVQDFIKTSIQRTQRLLRTPGSEVATEVTITDEYNGFAIPGDFLQLVALIADDDHEIIRTNLTNALRRSKNQGSPRVFARNRDKLVLGPRPLPGSIITIVYHADFSALYDATDENWLTQIAPDVIINGALEDACTHFNDPRADRFETKFTQGIVDLNLMAQADETTNASVEPGYSLDYASEEGF
ncbi:hypothetical protein GGR34_000745 [Microvirga flocculans]|uniref:Uncharacterized protein n=1 Tax=Microvirga flocculans TaxID=217168 RepID=A0A7W6ICV7_9HYPH|nr:hypothetical protein [Microvirga flocculans]MBB4039110.1 hypothetical protein [Microvirga flocculans]